MIPFIYTGQTQNKRPKEASEAKASRI